MPNPWEKLFDETLDDFKKGLGEGWKEMADDQKDILTRAAKDLCQAEYALLIGEGDAGVHRDIVLSCKSVLESEATLAAIRAARLLKDSFQRAVFKLLNVGLAALL